jgi:hypothetical protein
VLSLAFYELSKIEMLRASHGIDHVHVWQKQFYGWKMEQNTLTPYIKNGNLKNPAKL